MSRSALILLILALLLAGLVAFLLLPPPPGLPPDDPLEGRGGKPLKWSATIVSFTSACNVPRAKIVVGGGPNDPSQVLWVFDSADPRASFEIERKANEPQEIWNCANPKGRPCFRVPPGFHSVASGRPRQVPAPGKYIIWRYDIRGEENGRSFVCDPEVCIRDRGGACPF